MNYKVISIAVNELKVHPEHPKIYSVEETIMNLEGVIVNKFQSLIDDMVSSYNVIKHGEKTGQIYPIIITSDKFIISGVIRWLAAKQLGMTHILCIVYDPEIAMGLFIIQTNVGRGYTDIEKRKAALYLLSIIPQSQGVAVKEVINISDLPPVVQKVIEKGGERDAMVGEIVGLGKDSVKRLRETKEAEDSNPALCALKLTETAINYSAMEKKREQFLKEDAEKKEALNKPKITIDNTHFFVHHTDKILRFNEENRNNLGATSIPFWLDIDYEGNADPKQLGKEVSKEEFIENIASEFGEEYQAGMTPDCNQFVEVGDCWIDGEKQDIPNLICQAMKSKGWKLVQEIVLNGNKLPNNKGANREIVRLHDNTSRLFHFALNVEPGNPNHYYCRSHKMYNDSGRELIKKIRQQNADRTFTRADGFILSNDFERFKAYQEPSDTMTAYTDYLSRFEPVEYETFCEKYLKFLQCFDGSNVFTVANSGTRQKELQKINNTFKHPAVMNPLVMVVPLLEYCPDNGRCYDNFSGTGTTGIVCVSLGKGIVFTGRERNKAFRDLSMADFANWFRANNANQTVDFKPNHHIHNAA